MYSIAVEQNNQESLRLLCAQSQMYSSAKRMRAWHTSIVLILAILSPLFLIMPETIQSITGTIGAVGSIIGLVIEFVEASNYRRAATVQEEFDTKLFRLDWNKILVGNKVEPELIRIADRKFSGDRSKMTNWYPDPRPLPYPFDVLICQRANLVWDSQLRRVYSLIVLAVTILWLILGIAIAIISNQSLLSYLLAWFFPSLPATLLGLKLSYSHFCSARDRENTKEKLQSIWEESIKRPRYLTPALCREIQNCIFIIRSTNPPVPDFIYSFLRTRYEIDMRSGASDLKKEALNKLKPKKSS